jgi:mxaC protein
MLDFGNPWVLVLLPLAALPLSRGRLDSLPFSSASWLPRDPVGRFVSILWRVIAMVAMATIVVGLAGPGSSNLQRRVTGTGGEILVLMDRSASMDAVLGRGLENVPTGASYGGSKKQVASRALTTFVAHRPNDSFGFVLFGLQPMLAVPFTRDHAIVDAAMRATSVGRGMPDTRLDAGLTYAVRMFDGRPRTGGRAIVLVSDGGAHLDAASRARISAALAQNGVALYFVYLRSGVYSPDLTNIEPSFAHSAEAELHRFFQSLQTPYHLYQAKDEMASAMAEVGRRENPAVGIHRASSATESKHLVFCRRSCLLCRVGVHERYAEAELGMKRRAMHILFGGAAACCAGLALYYTVALQRAIDLDRAIAAASSATTAPLSAAHAGEAPEIRLARAVALSVARRRVDAGRLFNELIQGPAPASVRQAALFDLANIDLREAAGDDARGPVRSASLIELAKKRATAICCATTRPIGMRATTSSAHCVSPPRQPMKPTPTRTSRTRSM